MDVQRGKTSIGSRKSETRQRGVGRAGHVSALLRLRQSIARERPLDVRRDELLLTGVVSLTHHEDVPVARDEHAERHRFLRVIEARDVRVVVQDDGKVDSVTPDEGGHLGDRLRPIHGHADDEHALVLVLVVNRAKMRHLPFARLAEGRPEVEQNHLLPQMVAKAKRLAFDVAGGEIGGDRPPFRAAGGRGGRLRPGCRRTAREQARRGEDHEAASQAQGHVGTG